MLFSSTIFDAFKYVNNNVAKRDTAAIPVSVWRRRSEEALRWMVSSRVSLFNFLKWNYYLILQQKRYPDAWYSDITSNQRFYSLAATCDSKIIGIIIAEVRSKIACDREDLFILDKSFPDNTQITYILSIGVSQEYRRHGIGKTNIFGYLLIFENYNFYLKK